MRQLSRRELLIAAATVAVAAAAAVVSVQKAEPGTGGWPLAGSQRDQAAVDAPCLAPGESPTGAEALYDLPIAGPCWEAVGRPIR